MWLNINENYEISIDGNVRNKKTGRILKDWNNGDYKAVWLGAGNRHYIHRLVAERFLPMSTNICEVDHIDRNKHNNHASNLRWISHKENMNNRNRELNPRKSNKHGNQYIKMNMTKRQITQTFRVHIRSKLINHYSSHKTLEEAIKKRDEIINAV
jgi:hypothetical protein